MVMVDHWDLVFLDEFYILALVTVVCVAVIVFVVVVDVDVVVVFVTHIQTDLLDNELL